jgi:regulator of sirC expression with transglutaminase-like and TPR domain
MEVTERFAAAVAASSRELRLDVASFCIAAHAHVGLDVDAYCARLDALAAECPEPTFEALRVHLFDRDRFKGNTHDYADPENSFLDSVLDRRIGIPVTLSVLMMEVGRRLGVDVQGVGMPGHFLVRDRARVDMWCDPFHGGAVYDLDGCRALFARMYGGDRGFHPSYLSSISSHAIVARMLTNLEQGRLASDPAQLAWMCELHLALPHLAEAERKRLEVNLRNLRARWN